MNIPDSPFNADVLRMQFSSRALASSGLRPKQWGLVNDSNPCIALKRADSSMVYAPIESTNVLFSALKLSGLSGIGVRNIVVNADGTITTGSLSDNPSKGTNKVNTSDGLGSWNETPWTIDGNGEITTATGYVAITPYTITVEDDTDSTSVTTTGITFDKVGHPENSKYIGIDPLNNTRMSIQDIGGTTVFGRLAIGEPIEPNEAVTYSKLLSSTKAQGVLAWTGVTAIGLNKATIGIFTVSYISSGIRVVTTTEATEITPIWSADTTYSVIYWDTYFGEIKSVGSFLSNADRRTKLPLCVLSSVDGGLTVSGIIEDVYIMEDPIQSLRDMFQFCRPKKGLGVLGLSTAQFGIGAGVWYYMGLGAKLDLKNPNNYTTNSLSPATFFAVNRNVIESTTALTHLNTNVNGKVFSDWYDLNGTVTVLGAGKWQILRVYGVVENNATVPIVFVQRGQKQYDNYDDAFQGVATEPFTLNQTLDKMFCLGVIVIKKGATNTNTVTNGVTITSDTWGQMGGSGSSGSSTSIVHNDTSGLQGGSVGEYYHLSDEQFTALTQGNDGSQLHTHLLSAITDMSYRYKSVTIVSTDTPYGFANVGGILLRNGDPATISLNSANMQNGDWIDICVLVATGSVTITTPAVTKGRKITYEDGIVRVFYYNSDWYMGADNKQQQSISGGLFSSATDNNWYNHSSTANTYDVLGSGTPFEGAIGIRNGADIITSGVALLQVFNRSASALIFSRGAKVYAKDSSLYGAGYITSNATTTTVNDTNLCGVVEVTDTVSTPVGGSSIVAVRIRREKTAVTSGGGTSTYLKGTAPVGVVQHSSNTIYTYTATVTGAAVGDPVSVTMNAQLSTRLGVNNDGGPGWAVNAYVSAANTVTVQFRVGWYFVTAVGDAFLVAVFK